MISERPAPQRGKIDNANKKLCKMMESTEEALTIAAILPVFGTLAGAVKVGIGGSQFTLAVSCAIIGGIPLALSGHSTLLRCSWSHTKHGIGNIAAGIIEGIPGLGASIAFRHKIMPYSALTSKDY